MHGEEQEENASAEGERIAIHMFGVTRSWYGQIGAERVEANGKLTISAVLVVMCFLIVKFSAGIVID